MKTTTPTRLASALACCLFAMLTGCDFVQDVAGGNEPAANVKLFPVQLEDRWGYIDADGRMQIEPAFRSARDFSEGLAGAKSGSYYGFINADGEFAIEPRFSSVQPFTEGLAAVRFDGRWGFIDKSGVFEINPQFTSASPFSDGRAFVRTSDWSWEYIDKRGDVIRTEDTPRFDEHEDAMFADGLALVYDDGQFGYIDESGKPFIPLQYSAAHPFSEGRAAIKISDRWGFIDKNKNTVISPQFISAGSFGDGLAPVRQSGNLWGFVDRSGSLAVTEQFEEARSFSDSRAAVKLNDKWGFISTDGTVSTPIVFDEVRDFANGVAKVYLFDGEEEKMGYVDRSGEYLWYPTR